MQTLVTGSRGFIAQYLIKELLSEKVEVTGIVRSKSENSKIIEKVGDINDSSFIHKVIIEVNPQVIYHLAAQSNIPYSWDHPDETIRSNVTGTLHLLDSIKNTDTIFLSVGSSAEYGFTAKDNHSLSEDVKLEPTSPYGVSKMCQGEFIKLYRKAFNLKTVHVRPFAVIGPGKKGDAMTDFAKGIVSIERGVQRELTVGNLSTMRDFIDVRDAVTAMTFLTKKDSPEIVNICLGKGTTLSEVLEIMITHAKTKIPVKMNKIAKRPMDDLVLVGDPSRLFSLGFKPEITLEQSIKDILDYWRNII